MKFFTFGVLYLVTFVGNGTARATEAQAVKSAMKKASEFYSTKIARHGGYAYYTAPDFSWRHGEGRADESQIWVQPPGTPTVGMAYLRAYDATGDDFYLKAALTTAEALIYGQLKSGAWTNSISFDPRSDKTALYRNGKGRGRNFSTLDDGISQAAIQFLVRLDKATEFKNIAVHESAGIALKALLAAQFPNGAFPQGWDETLPRVESRSDLKGNFPKYDWRNEGRIKEYWDQYTLNDDLALTVSKTLITAHQVYQDKRYLEALKSFGNFLIRSQMPEPQPGWAQQYNYDMQPIWARKFEPPAISGRETEGVIASLIRIARYTRDKKYLTPIAPAMAWLKRSLLPNGQLARYYELETNKPLYMKREGKQYSPTHDDSRLPSHYGWKNDAQIESLESALGRIRAHQALPDSIFPNAGPDPPVKEILDGLNREGVWISTFQNEPLVGQPKFRPGEQYIDSAIFCRNLNLLSRHLKTLK